MYSIILSIEACILLLFSFITIVILLRKQFKQWMYTSLYVLSMSDVLFSILIAGVLLINYMESNMEIFNDIVFINNNTWNKKDQKDTSNKFHKILMNIIKQNNSNTTHDCNTMHIILHYGVFLIPFTNSFISLLMFSAQCNLNIFNFKKQCSKFFEFKKNIGEDNNINKSDSESIEKSEEFQFDSKSTLIQYYKKRLIKVFQYNALKGNNKMIVIIFIINQWIIPIAVTGLLYSIGHTNDTYSKDTETVICFENYFLLNDFHYGAKTSTAKNTTHNYSNVYDMPLHKNYTDTKLIITLNATKAQVNEIISKVQSIVHTAIDGTYNTSQYITYVEPYNMSELLNMMKDLEFNTHTGVLKHGNDNINSTESFMKETVELEYESAFNLTSPNMTNLLSNIQSENNITEYDKEEQLFHYLMTNASENMLLEKDNSDNEIITTETSIFNILQANNMETVEEFVETTTENNVPVITNDQIYTEILKRIHSAVHHTTKNNYKKQPKSKILEQDPNNNSMMNKSNIASVNQSIAYKSNNASNKTSMYIMDKYSTPVKLLNLYLLLLLFIIYFLPILFCVILHQRGKLNCQFLLDKLKANNKISNISNDNLTSNVNNIQFEQSVDPKGAITLRRDSIISKESTKEMQQNFTAFEQIEIFNENSVDKENKSQECNKSDEKRMELNMIIQMENTLKIFDTIKMSLLCGTILWTPILFEILSKVFAQMSVPEWLFNTTYLVAITFNIIRNSFNLKMIKLQDMDASVTKTNSIHPII